MTYIGSKTNNINNIIFKDINEDYSFGKYGDFNVIIMKKNGYINATKLCSNAETKNGTRKEFYRWLENNNSKILIKEISTFLEISQDKLLITITGGSKKLTIIRGTYIHPLLITHIAYWISPKFAINVSLWIDEWKKYSNENLIKYYDTLSKLDTYERLEKEKEIQLFLQEKLGGNIEVDTKIGRIDLLTNDSLIEIKTYKDWKCALGQLLAYSIFYPQKKLYMYLFDVKNNDTKLINKICNKNNINLMIYD